MTINALDLFNAYAEATHKTTTQKNLVLKAFGGDFKVLGSMTLEAIFNNQDILPHDLVLMAEDFSKTV